MGTVMDGFENSLEFHDVESRNLSRIEDRHPHLLELLERVSASGLELIPSRKGPPTLLVTSGEGTISLHSRMDPEKEAEDFALGLEVESTRKILVILGLGLGYHVRALVAKWPEDAPVVVVEANPEVLAAAVRNSDLEAVLDRPGLEFIVGLDPDAVQRRISRLSTAHGLLDFEVRLHPPSGRWQPDYYRNLARNLEAATPGLLRQRLTGPRWKADRARLLFLDSGYFLSREIVRASRLLGHEIRPIRVPDRNLGSEETVREILTQAAELRPDFILTVNHLGFDARGVLADVLAGMNLPWASWFVDSPRLILGADHDRHRLGSVFLWDRSYAAEVKAMGYAHVHDLPLAADEALFRPPETGGREDLDLAFVGDSMVGPVNRSLARLNPPQELWGILERAAIRFIGLRDHSPLGALEEVGALGHGFVRGLSPDGVRELEGLVTWRATQIFRLGVLEGLAEFKPRVVGDSGWTGLLNPEIFELRPEMGYYEDLPGFYPRCRINLNVTSQQMKTGVNQRVFDVPACGGFLLTDWRPGLEELFDPGKEAVFYRDPDEARDLARYFLAHDRTRREIALKARTKVLERHTYGHRLARLVDCMRRDHP